ncbi:MAG: hypothetical protein KDE27_32285 [Planctomycetes bacterium]|nr:hypothetical protein [Planctomycetota bacterium]
MRPFSTIREILDEIRALHRERCEDFAAAAAGATDHRLQALLSFLRDREAEQLAALGRFERGGDDLLDGYVQSVPADAMAVAAAGVEPGGDFDAVVRRYRERDRALIQVYEQLAAGVGPRAAAAFLGLLELRRQAQARLREALLDA